LGLGAAGEREKQSQGKTGEMRRHGAFHAPFRSLALMESLARRMRPRQLPLRVAGVPISGAGHGNGQPVCCIHSMGNGSISLGSVTPSGWRPFRIALTISDAGKNRGVAV
jgi:hypothetical protein